MRVSPSVKVSVLKKAFPKLHTVGAVYDPALHEDLVEEYRAACKRSGIRMVAMACKSSNDTYSAVEGLVRTGCKVWILFPDSRNMGQSEFSYIRKWASRNGAALIGFRSKDAARNLVLVGMQPHLGKHAMQAVQLGTQLLRDPKKVPGGGRYADANSTIGQLSTNLSRLLKMQPAHLPSWIAR